MIGAHSMEGGVLGGYVDFIRRTKPNAPLPAVLLAERLFGDAERLRARIGDGAFFRSLNEVAQAAPGHAGWGDIAEAWTPESFDEALAAPPVPSRAVTESEKLASAARLRLVDALCRTLFQGYVNVIRGQAEQYLPFDQGLSVISRHACDLGYDALLLFLDELILWLATRSIDLDFVKRESAKLTNLVEAQTPDRPVPIVSFVARQRDLRKLIGDHIAGAERLNFSDSLKWQEGRFIPHAAKNDALHTNPTRKRGNGLRPRLRIGLVSKLAASSITPSRWRIVICRPSPRSAC